MIETKEDLWIRVYAEQRRRKLLLAAFFFLGFAVLIGAVIYRGLH